MTWKFWCSFLIVLNLFIIVTKTESNLSSLIIENIIPKKINPDILRIDIKKTDGNVVYQLEFTKTKGILANSRTPVIKYLDNIENREMLIKFYPDYEVMQGIGNFSFYHDIDNKASAVLFSDSNGIYLDGIIGDAFRLNRFPVNYLNNILKRPERHIIKESDSIVESPKENTWSKLNNAVQNVGASYPELLIVLDYNLIANISKIQAIKTQLVYWNAVDMLFASMKSPEIYINIAAFVLPSSKHAFQFLENDPGTTFVDFYDAIEGVETLFYKYRNQISFDYDIIVAMTGTKLCVRPTRANPVMNCINGVSEGKPDILNKFDDERETVDSSAILHFDNQVSSYTNAAQKIGYMFTGEFTLKKEMKKCPGIMEEYYRRGKFSLSWSTCTQRKVADYLQSPKAKGLKNFPKYLSEEKKSQLLPIEQPKPSKGWLSNLGNWLLKKNEDKNDEKSDVIITTQPFVHETTQLTISTEASLSEISEKVPNINKPNIDLQQKFTTSETSLAELTDLITTTESFLPEIIEKIHEITEKVPEINEFNTGLEQESTKSGTFSNNLSTTPNPRVFFTTVPSSQNYIINDISTASTSSRVYSSIEPPLASFLDENKKNESLNSKFGIREEEINTSEPVNNYPELRMEDLSSTTTKLLIEKSSKRQNDYIFIDVTVPSEESDASVVDDHTDVSENNLEESTVSLELNQQNLLDTSVIEPVVEEQIVRQKRQNPLSSKTRTVIHDDNELLVPERQIKKASDEEILGHEREGKKISDEDLIAHEREGEKISDEDLIAHEREGEKISDEDLIAHEREGGKISEKDLLTNEKNDQEMLSDEQEGAEASDKVSPTLEELKSSLESTSSPTQPSCKREKMKLDVTLELNINTNDKNIKTLKKSFDDGSLNQENDNATDTNDNRIIKNIIDYLLKNSDG